MVNLKSLPEGDDLIWCWRWMNGSQGGAYRERPHRLPAASSTERPRSRACAETPGYVVRPRPIHSRCRLRPGYKSAQDIAGRPSVVRASWTFELRKKAIPACHPVISGKRSETAARRRFSFLPWYVSAPSQPKDRSARRTQSSFGRWPSGTSRQRSETRPRGSPE